MKPVSFLLVVLGAAATALPAADSAAAGAAPAEPGAPLIRRIDVRGNKNVNTGLVLSNFTLKAGDRYSGKEAQESLHSLYGLGLFSDLTIESEEASGDSFTLVIAVREHPLLNELKFKGNDELDEDDLEEKVNLPGGTVLSPPVIQKARRAILDAYQEKGYLLAEVVPNTYESKESGKTDLEFEVREGHKVKIKKIIFEGTAAFKGKKLKGVMEDTKEDRWWRGGDYNEDKFASDLKRVEDFYRNEGYLDARVADQDIVYSADKKDLTITLRMFEGHRYFLGNAGFDGNELLDDALLSGNLTLKNGDLFRQQDYDISKFNVESAYREEGYLYVQLKDEKSYRGDTIDVTFRIKEGLPAYINKVVINGNTKTWDKVIQREVGLRPGDIYRQSKLMLSQRDILQLNYFDQVTPDVRTNPDRSVDLVVDVKEKETGTGQVSAGAGYSQRDGFVFNTGLSMPNFAITRPFVEGAGQTVDLQLEYGKYSRRFDMGFTEPWFMDTPTLVGFRGFYWWRDWSYGGLSDIQETRKGAELRLGRRLRWPDIYFRVYSSYNISHREFLEGGELQDNRTDQGLTIRNSGFESTLSLRLTRNSTDLPDFPTKGSVVEYNPSLSGYFLGGQYKYVKHILTGRAFLPTFWKLVLVQNLKFSHLTGSVIGRYDHFLAGGVNFEGVIRGYPDRAFGDLFTSGEHVGYNLVVYSTELQYPIMERRLYLSLFSDFGNTWARLTDVDFSELLTGVGSGVKLQVPMLGLIGFDFALGLDDYPSRVDSHNNTWTHQSLTDEKPPYFEIHFRFGRPF